MNWIRWHKTTFIVSVVLAISVGAGVYTYSTVKSASNASSSALILEKVLACETPLCVDSAIEEATTSELFPLLDKIAAETKPTALQNSALMEQGGLCVIAGNAIGLRVALTSDLNSYKTLIDDLEYGKQKHTNEAFGYPCQLGFANGLAEGFSSKADFAQAVKTVEEICAEYNGNDPSVRPDYTPKATTCLRSAGSFATLAAVSNKGNWGDVIEACNSKHPMHTASCLEGGLFQLTDRDNSLDMEYAMCAEAKLQEYCEMAVARTKTIFIRSDITASDDYTAFLKTVCEGATDPNVCRHGYYLGAVNGVQSLNQCAFFGSLTAECTDVVLVRSVLGFLRLSNQRGEVINDVMCSRLGEIQARCEEISAKILDYDFKSGLI